LFFGKRYSNTVSCDSTRAVEVADALREDGSLNRPLKSTTTGFEGQNSVEGSLIRMEERLRVLKGTFSIDSQAKRGTKINARAPLGSRSDSMRAAGQIAPQSPG
jgi:signal transduction histidine kinase